MDKYSLLELISNLFSQYNWQIITAIISIITILLGCNYLIFNLNQFKKNHWLIDGIKKIKTPVMLLSIIFFLILIERVTEPYLIHFYGTKINKFLSIFTVSNKIIIAAVFIWIIWVIFNSLNTYVISSSQKKMAELIFPVLINCFKAGIIFLILTILISDLGMLHLPKNFLEKFSIVFLTALASYAIYQVTTIIEKIVIYKYTEENHDPASVRKIKTQLSILKSTVLTIAIVILVASGLLMFDSARNLGAGLLTTAGIASAVGAFASQKTLMRLFSGMQIAFTQPVRLGDTVIIENEFGEVEEISLSYVVIKLWDLRRLIIPTDYITTNGLQNLSRTSTQLLGTIFIYVDYTLPIDAIRNHFLQVINDSANWDKRVSVFQVTDLKEFTLELRAVVSASNAGKLWDLRCEIREKIVKFIVDTHPNCLPRLRVEFFQT